MTLTYRQRAITIVVLTISLVSLLSSLAQAQQLQAFSSSQQLASSLVLLPPVDQQTPRGVGPAPVPERIPPGRNEFLGIADLESIATVHNPTLALASQRLAALQGKHVQVGLQPNPIIGYKGEDMGEDGAAGKQGLFLGKRIVTAGKLELNRAVVSYEIQQAQQDMEIQRLRVINAVRGRAYETIMAQRTVALNERLSAIGQEGVKAAERLRQAREVSQVDVLQAQVEASTARLALNNARNNHKATWHRLAVVMGVPDMPTAPLIDNLGEAIPQLFWDNAVARLMTESPELARAHSGVERAKCALARAQAGRRPDFDVEAVVQYNNATEDTMATIGVGVPLQIYNRNQGNISKAHAELTAAHREVRRVELLLQDRLVEVFTRYTNARQQVEQYRTEILPNAKSSLDLTQKGYQAGELGYLELLTAQRTYFRVNLAYLTSLRELWLSAVKIEGLLLTGGLKSPGS